MRTVLKYPGAKWREAEWIVGMMPPHKSYLEPFFGSGAIFFIKEPSPIETINDLDGDIVNLYTCLRDHMEELCRVVALTPYSREEYEAAWAERDSMELSPIERARLTLVRYWQTHGSNAAYRNGWKCDVAGREYAYAAQYWARLPAWMAATVERLKTVQIEQTPAVELIRRYRSSEVLVYADPPYLLSTRKGRQYRMEMEDRDHEELLAALLDHPGPVMLSGYDSDLYNDTLKGWEKHQKKSQCEKGLARVETLWVNFEVQTRLEL